MASQGYPISGLLVLLGLLTNFITVSSSHESASFNRTSFPKGFIFGTAAAAYQVTKSKFSLCCIIVFFFFFFQMSWDVKHMINIIMCTCVFFQISSTKVQQKKMVEDQVYGTRTLIDIQVSSFSLSLSLQQYET